MKIPILFLISFLILFSWISNGQDQRGVYFNSKEVSLEKRTGIDLTKRGAITYSGSFSIDFEIAFRDIEQRYGYILQLKETNEGNQFDLIYNIDGKFPDLFIVHNKKETNLQLGLTTEQIEKVNRWRSFNLTVDAESGEVSMTFAGKTVRDRIKLPLKSKLEWVFGIVNRYGFDIDEVAPISLKNIRFSEQDKLRYFWPLSYSQKNIAKDSVCGKAAYIANPAWVIDRHRTWQKITTFRFSEFPQIAFNKLTEEISFVQRRSGITRFSLNSRKVNVIDYRQGNPFYEDAQQAFFDRNNQLRTYSKYKQMAPRFDETIQGWDNSFDTLAYLPKYWHHNSLLHPVDSSFVTIGGYGFFTYFNTVRKLNDTTKVWEELGFAGSQFEPRYLASLGQSGTNKNEYYFFGGLGNATGKQILGKEFYYDLYKINFKTNRISKLWELEEIAGNGITPVNNMVINEQDDCFYTLCFPHGGTQSYLQLFKAGITMPEFKFIGSKIPYIFHDISSFADLYHWESHNKLVAITVHRTDKGDYEVNLYDLIYPPSELEPVVLKPAQTGYYNYLYIVLFVVLLFFITILILRKNRSKPSEVKLTGIPASEPDEAFDQKDERGRILTFGGFQVIDKTGKDITYRFSPTLKELFLLILLYTVDGNKGISSRKIQEFLWPDKPGHKAKNNRGVNIKKLRFILEDVGDVKISYDGNCWRINHDQEVFCDIEYIRHYFSEVFNTASLNGFEKVITVLRRGNFLINTETEWLDKMKDDISGRIVNRLEEVCNVLDMRKHEEELLEIADVLFTFDQMNERALQLKCYILNHQGKHSLALEVYNHYIKLYQKLYNEEFNRSFKELLS